MTFFGLLWFVIVLYSFSRSDMKYMFFVTLLFMTFQCDNVLKMGEFSVGPQLLTSLVFLIKVFIHKKGKITCRCGEGRLLLVSFLLLGAVIASCVYNGTLGAKILPVLQLTVYIFTFLSMLLMAREMKEETLYQIIRTIVIFLLIVGVGQLLTTTELLPLRPLLKAFFYNDNASNVMFHTAGYRRIMSTFMEPSYYAGLLVGAFTYFLSLQDHWRENILLFIGILFEIIMTMSTTAYVSLLITGILFVICSGKIRMRYKIGIVILAVLGSFVFCFGFFHMLNQVIFSKLETGSYITRSKWNEAALRSYKSSVWFGVGYKNARGSSMITTLLGETGRLGLIAYLLFNAVIVAPLFTDAFTRHKYSKFYIGMVFAILSVILCQLIACPDLDLCTYWFWIFAFGASSKASPYRVNRAERPADRVLCPETEIVRQDS